MSVPQPGETPVLVTRTTTATFSTHRGHSPAASATQPEHQQKQKQQPRDQGQQGQQPDQRHVARAPLKRGRGRPRKKSTKKETHGSHALANLSPAHLDELSTEPPAKRGRGRPRGRKTLKSNGIHLLPTGLDPTKCTRSGLPKEVRRSTRKRVKRDHYDPLTGSTFVLEARRKYSLKTWMSAGAPEENHGQGFPATLPLTHAAPISVVSLSDDGTNAIETNISPIVGVELEKGQCCRLMWELSECEPLDAELRSLPAQHVFENTAKKLEKNQHEQEGQEGQEQEQEQYPFSLSSLSPPYRTPSHTSTESMAQSINKHSHSHSPETIRSSRSLSGGSRSTPSEFDVTGGEETTSELSNEREKHVQAPSFLATSLGSYWTEPQLNKGATTTTTTTTSRGEGEGNVVPLEAEGTYASSEAILAAAAASDVALPMPDPTGNNNDRNSNSGMTLSFIQKASKYNENVYHISGEDMTFESEMHDLMNRTRTGSVQLDVPSWIPAGTYQVEVSCDKLGAFARTPDFQVVDSYGVQAEEDLDVGVWCKCETSGVTVAYSGVWYCCSKCNSWQHARCYDTNRTTENGDKYEMIPHKSAASAADSARLHDLEHANLLGYNGADMKHFVCWYCCPLPRNVKKSVEHIVLASRRELYALRIRRTLRMISQSSGGYSRRAYDQNLKFCCTPTRAAMFLRNFMSDEERANPTRCIDLGAGTGSISRALPAGAVCVEKNSGRFHYGEKHDTSHKWIHEDVLNPKFIIDHAGKYDLVISNPDFEVALDFLFVGLQLLRKPAAKKKKKKKKNFKSVSVNNQGKKGDSINATDKNGSCDSGVWNGRCALNVLPPEQGMSTALSVSASASASSPASAGGASASAATGEAAVAAAQTAYRASPSRSGIESPVSTYTTTSRASAAASHPLAPPAELRRGPGRPKSNKRPPGKTKNQRRMLRDALAPPKQLDESVGKEAAKETQVLDIAAGDRQARLDIVAVASRRVEEEEEEDDDDEKEEGGIGNVDLTEEQEEEDEEGPRMIFLLPSDFFEASALRARLYKILDLHVKIEYKLGHLAYYADTKSAKLTVDSYFEFRLGSHNKFTHKTVNARLAGMF